MASESSRGLRASRSTASTQRRILSCHHKEKVVLRVSGMKENLGKRFLGCVRYAEQEEEDLEKARMRKKVSSLKSRLRACELRLKIVVFVGMVGWALVFSLWLQNSGGTPQHQWLLRFWIDRAVIVDDMV
ncbi:hypothetical protein PIB30_000491 [Stylosanthes scabra]|uniref:Zinc finger GRF-type domain-containing protein n=1 Tax=Stylosanthes scabra TaxID=79078 RepID=A0ABU6W3Z7_9FABA|nr:hypothetical protein [Stylosanthes scabra]